MRTFNCNICDDEHGTTAVEFAIVGPVFILLVIGIVYLCMCLSVVASMHYAVQEGARCASVRTAVCTDKTSTKAYTQNHYFGPGTLPDFIPDDTAACGNSVTGSVSYVLDLGLRQITIPISAAACFPRPVPAP